MRQLYATLLKSEQATKKATTTTSAIHHDNVYKAIT